MIGYRNFRHLEPGNIQHSLPNKTMNNTAKENGRIIPILDINVGCHISHLMTLVYRRLRRQKIAILNDKVQLN